MSGEIETLALLMSWSLWFSPKSRGKEKMGAGSLSLVLPTSLGRTSPQSSIPSPLKNHFAEEQQQRRYGEKREWQVLICMLQGCSRGAPGVHLGPGVSACFRGGSGAWCVRTHRVAFVHTVGIPGSERRQVCS